jgi:hypothetical protein
MNKNFNWKDQVNSIIQKVYTTLRRLWTSADLIPTETRKKLIVALVVPLFLNSDVIISKASKGMANRLRIVLNSCASRGTYFRSRPKNFRNSA